MLLPAARICLAYLNDLKHIILAAIWLILMNTSCSELLAILENIGREQLGHFWQNPVK